VGSILGTLPKLSTSVLDLTSVLLSPLNSSAGILNTCGKHAELLEIWLLLKNDEMLSWHEDVMDSRSSESNSILGTLHKLSSSVFNITTMLLSPIDSSAGILNTFLDIMEETEVL
jgi:hypothetical protein